MRVPFAALLLLGAVFVAPSVQADPAAIIANLQGRTPTLLDLSLARLEGYLQADGAANGYSAFAGVEDDRIKILAWSPGHPGTEEACRALLTRLRTIAGVDPETGWPLDPATLFATYFNYTSFTAFEVDQSYDETVDSMIELTAVSGIAGNDEAYICQGPLLSTDVAVSRE
jgi:hypothetical protein